MDYIKMVEEFHRTFSAPVLETPQIPSKERCDLRINLMQEELDEIKVAIENNDFVEISDGLCDLMYVLCGSILEFGLKDKFNELFNEVHESNMSKACLSEKEASETVTYYKSKDGTEAHYQEIDGKWLVFRDSDNKVLKSINYTPANIKKFLTK
jgi:predicted HAD superfamily Cof-like phosphohydrolase